MKVANHQTPTTLLPGRNSAAKSCDSERSAYKREKNSGKDQFVAEIFEAGIKPASSL